MSNPAARNAIAQHVEDWISTAITVAPAGHIPLLFLSGAQGSGKSTALRQAAASLTAPVAIASLDDFYLTRTARAHLANTISPLLATRGPPGTHDLPLLRATLASLRAASDRSATSIPVFDKLADDRAASSAWRVFQGRPAAIVIEGWLMGALPDATAPSSAPLNEVEAQDPAGTWRRFQEEALAGGYARLWDEADGFFHILAPGFDTVLGWRLEQEASLWQARGTPMPEDRRAWAARFIQYYERITRRMLEGGRRPGTDLLIDGNRCGLPPPP
ncbi:conserved hypothetical protein [Hyphomonas neptunium ATCC 15444]|uniref:Kinase n=2 Tax=Hyphomonas TaxID=85 RepID=Q0BYM0_HYPNA|nr:MULTISPECIES: hypothetical protein [Hyphomonas]ABI77021.1 conserved hypothetical protein [Hyphomonas neptunium ATCC 15444]KCZ91549.1 hypothetical protein HHI_13194 [Hyphomonas hirschiana VP5]